jgi:cytochrome c oxidase subunit IV
MNIQLCWVEIFTIYFLIWKRELDVGYQVILPPVMIIVKMAGTKFSLDYTIVVCGVSIL